MPYYNCLIPFSGHISTCVFAKNEEEARTKAQQKTSGYLVIKEHLSKQESDILFINKWEVTQNSTEIEVEIDDE